MFGRRLTFRSAPGRPGNPRPPPTRPYPPHSRRGLCGCRQARNPALLGKRLSKTAGTRIDRRWGGTPVRVDVSPLRKPGGGAGADEAGRTARDDYAVGRVEEID